MRNLIIITALFSYIFCFGQNEANEFKIGEQAPPFILIDNKGNEVRLSDFRGKLLLLDFWASYCGPCRQQYQTFFKPLYNKLKCTNFEILGISKDIDVKQWHDAINNDNLEWPQVCLSLNTNKVEEEYQIKYLPTTILIDDDGTILGKNLTKIELVELIHKKFDNENISLNKLYDVTKNYKEWEEFLEDLNYEIDKYIYEYTIYPEIAKENDIIGSIPVMLSIGKDFKIELLTFLKTVPGTKGKEEVKKLGYGCEEEAKRVIDSMKNWKSFPYVQRENVYSTLVYIYFPPQKPVRREIKLEN